MRALPAVTFLVLASSLAAQIAPGNAVVACRLTGSPATQLLAVDLTNGIVATLPRFPADTLQPLAVEFDRIDSQLLLALDAGNGISRVFRYAIQNGLPVQERALGDVPGRVTDLTLGADQILAAVDGQTGGIYRMPRNGGPGVLWWPQPDLTVLRSSAPNATAVITVWSAPPPSTANPGAGYRDVGTGSFSFGPTSFQNYPHPVITGVMELPYPQPRLVLTHADGAVTLHQTTFGGGAQPTPLLVQPPPPAGGANSMKQRESPWQPVVLGGSAFPVLWTFDPMVANPVMTMLSQPLFGDPVDFAIAPSAEAWLRGFGSSCGPTPTPMAMVSVTPPILGSTTRLQLNGGTPNSMALFVLGSDDQLGGVLPFQLPSGCLLLVSPEVVLPQTANTAGYAFQSLSIPSQPWFAGLTVFAQWLQAPGVPFATSNAIAILIGS